jgi:Cu(I)/Ag(I) efflux system membrane fusion protein
VRFGRVILLLGLVSALAVLAAAAVRFWPTGPASSRAKAESTREEWTCSMHPQVKLPGPGKCPLCGMNLIPVSRVAAAKEPARAEASALPESRSAAPLETVPVAYRALAREIRTVGKLDYNERGVAYITARVAGRVDRLYADFTGIQVKTGDHLADIYSPELYTAQSELFLALDSSEKAQSGQRLLAGDLARGNLEATRTKLRLWGITPEQLSEIEHSRKTRTHLTIYAPIGATVIEKAVREGQYVKEGDLLYRVADPDPIWLYLDIYEYDLGWVRYGQAVDVTVEAYPGETFHGTVTFIDPFLDDRTRTVKVRVNLANPDRRLKPAMYASAVIRLRLSGDGSPEPTGLEGKFWCPMHPEVVRDQPGRCPICQMPLERVPATRPPAGTTVASNKGHGEHAGHGHVTPEPSGGPAEPGLVLAVPASAVLDTGTRRVAYRQTKGGGYELVEIQVGPRCEGQDEFGRAESYYPLLRGLRDGDRVVIRGGFLLDSQRQIEGMPSLFYPQGQAAADLHAGHGGAPTPAATPPGPGHQH